jgi:hypothetical protein
MAEQSAKKYVVIPLSLSGMGNKIFHNGDIVTGDQVAINGRTVEGLIKDGFIKEMTEKSENKKEAESENKSESANDEPKDEPMNPIFTTADGKEVFTQSDCTKNEIKAELKSRDIKFDSKDSKNALFQKLQ